MIDTNEIREHLKRADARGHKPFHDDDMFLVAGIYTLCDEIDRLRAAKPKTQGKTVRVKVPVSVANNGSWVASGGSEIDIQTSLKDCEHYPEEGDVLYWLTADLPVPEEVEVKAEVEGE